MELYRGIRCKYLVFFVLLEYSFLFDEKLTSLIVRLLQADRRHHGGLREVPDGR